MEPTRVGSDLERATDLELLGRVQKRDQRAYEVLFHRYYARIFAFVNQRLQDPGLTEETVVDVFYTVWDKAGAFRGDSRPSTWLFGIAHLKAVRANRTRSAGKRASVIPIETAALQRAPDPRDSEAVLGARDEMRRLEEVVERALSGKLREAAVLVWLEGLSYEEAGERLQVSSNTVKLRVSRARRRVRQELRPMGAER